MYRRYQENPHAVGEAWREFFEDYKPLRQAPPAPEKGGQPREPKPREVTPGATTPEAARAPEEPRREERAPEPVEVPEDATPLRGIAARIAENMQASLGVPTATSARSIPAKLLEENRRVMNRSLSARGGKVSFTHMIGYALLKALEVRPGMKASYAEIDGKPHVIQHKNVNFGLAVDVARSDGTRVLVVPNIKNANELDFRGFFSAYEEVIRRVRANE